MFNPKIEVTPSGLIFRTLNGGKTGDAATPQKMCGIPNL
jgi:hypothetical protein